MIIFKASLLSSSVIMWQILLGIIQVGGFFIKGRVGAFVGFILVLLWTITQTYDELMVLQLIVQSIIAIVIYTQTQDK